MWHQFGNIVREMNPNTFDRIESSFSRNSGAGSQSWGVVNVSTATVDQITALGFLNLISQKLAKAIVDYRNEKGPSFRFEDELISSKSKSMICSNGEPVGFPKIL